MLSGLCNCVQRILPLVKQVADGIVSEETKFLKDFLPRMFRVMHWVAKLSCDYVKRGMRSSPRFDKVLMIIARTISSPAYPMMIEEMERELTGIIEDFDHAMNFEALCLLCLASETSKLPYSQSVDS